MALVKSYVSERGNTINIFDDFIVKTQEEVDEILKALGRIAGEAMMQQEKKKQYESRLIEKGA